jgi:DNA-binding response OmpR family regulator
LALRHETVLLVDDNELLLHGMKRFFARDFQHVTAVSTGEEAITEVRRRFFHIVVLDINLPRMDGWEVLSRIMHHSPASRVVIITAREDRAVRQRAIEKGAVDLLGKPFHLKELKDIVIKILSYCERDRRVGRSFEVEIERRYRGLTHNLSATGMLVLTNVTFEPAATLSLMMRVGSGEQISLKGQVVRTVDWSGNVITGHLDGAKNAGAVTYGLGVRLIEQSPAYSSFISSLLA